jgi:class 3 adenylate cyclase
VSDATPPSDPVAAPAVSGAVPDVSVPDIAAPEPKHRSGISIQSILLLMFLFVSLLSTVVVGLIGYTNGNDSLRNAAFDRLIEVRDSRAREITSLFTQIHNSVLLQARDTTTVDADEAFTAGFDNLSDAKLSDAENSTLDSYFTNTFAPALSKASGTTVDPQSFLPTTPAEKYLQLHYTTPYKTFDQSLATTDAGDGSDWSAANAQYQDQFSRITTLSDYEDVLLLDTQGNVVYTAYKGVDLGTNLRTGPYSSTKLAAAYNKVMSSNILDEVQFTDFEQYTPSLTDPAAWAVAPIGDNGTVVGAYAVELPNDAINKVMTTANTWDTSVLGKTGETYLVGADSTMRSQSRELVQQPKTYVKQAVAAGTPRAVANRAVADKSPILLQSVQTDAVAKALAGKSGTILSTSYLGQKTLAAYAPLEVQGLKWVVVAELGSGEAFSPVNVFTRNLVLSALAVFVLVALLSLILARVIIRPLRRLQSAATRIAAGEEDVTVDEGSSDEFADVGKAFNDMSRSLSVKANLLEAQEAENERLLLTLMPEAVAKRYKGGDQDIAEDHTQVTVLYADIVGFDEATHDLPSDKALATLNELVHSFDEAAEEHGVERVRTTRNGYLASCGLTIPRVDNARRMVDFAIEMQNILDRFGAQKGVKLALRAGIDTGTVTSGLVGRSHIIYDLWGETVNLAFRVQASSVDAGIFMTQAVADKLPDTIKVTDGGTIDTTGGDQKIWQVDPSDDANG